MARPGLLVLEDGSTFPGELFGGEPPAAGEVVFSTGMVGYPESLTDPSYAGQILVFTYPSIGNYGVPGDGVDEHGLPLAFESDRVQVEAVVVASCAADTSHWTARASLDSWLARARVPAIAGVDTRAIAKRIRSEGAMLGKVVAVGGSEIPFRDHNLDNLVARVSCPAPGDYGGDGPRIVVVDTGVKANIIRSLLASGARVLRVPWDHDFMAEDLDGLVLANGPGDPKLATATVANVRRAIAARVPTFGICLGNQILALAAGANTYKLKFGHRSHNQPCHEVGTRRTYITSQNHGFAVEGSTLPEGWREWFVNANDGSNEGIRHDFKPLRSVQFHPEASPGPTDTADLFRRFLEMVG